MLFLEVRVFRYFRLKYAQKVKITFENLVKKLGRKICDKIPIENFL